MKLAIMQPYAFPYLGYFQLIHAVDRFLLYDDVAFSKQGWANRNNLGATQGRQRFTLPVCKPKLGQPICEIRMHEAKRHQRRLLKTIDALYGRASHFQEARPVLEQAICQEAVGLADYVRRSLEVLNRYLGIHTPIVRSSERHRALATKGQQRVIDICRAERAETYINAEGGRRLYQEPAFRQAGIELHFLVHEPQRYRQNSREFLPRLSIIDVVMWNSPDEIGRLLRQYRLVRAGEAG